MATRLYVFLSRPKVFAALVALIAIVLALASVRMALAQTTYNPRPVVQSSIQVDAATTSFTAPGVTDSVSFLVTNVGVQITGTASSFTATLQRSATDPSVSATWTTIASYSGAPASVAYATWPEPGVGWWRINVTAVTGGTVIATLTGRRG